jgi:uncharacterized membrane protein
MGSNQASERFSARQGLESVASPPVRLDASIPRRSVRRLAPSLDAVRSLTRPAVIVPTASLLWIALFLTMSIRAYRAFLYHRFDLGNMTQAVWATAHGHPFEVTALTGQQINRMGAHVDPFLALLAPLWWVWGSPEMLLAVQVVALGLGALPVFWLGRKHLASERAAMYLALSYLLYPGLQWRAPHDFHPAVVAVSLLLFAIWYLDEEKLGRFVVFAVLVAATQEQMGVLVAGLGVWYGLRKRRWGIGALIAGAGTAWTLTAVFLVIPHFSGGPSPFGSRYASVGGSPTGILRRLLSDPWSVISAATTPSDLRFMLWFVVPFLGLFLLAPTLALIAAPQLLLSLLSDRGTDLSLNCYLSAPVIPFVIVGTVLGVARLRRHETVAKLVLLTTGLSCLIGPLPSFGTLAPGSSVHSRAAAAALSRIPSGAAVAATNDLASHLSARRRVYLFPVVSRADWVAVDLRDDFMPSITPGQRRVGFAVPRDDLLRRPVAFRAAVARLARNPSWTLVFARNSVRVWHRKHASGW